MNMIIDRGSHSFNRLIGSAVTGMNDKHVYHITCLSCKFVIQHWRGSFKTDEWLDWSSVCKNSVLHSVFSENPSSWSFSLIVLFFRGLQSRAALKICINRTVQFNPHLWSHFARTGREECICSIREALEICAPGKASLFCQLTEFLH